MRVALLAVAALAGASGAAAQSRGIVLQTQPQASPLLPAPSTPRTLAPSQFQPAPLPNRDYEAPAGPRASNDPQVSPGFFTRRDAFRGDGFSRGSTSESETEKRVRPGAGFSLHMPLQGQ